METRNILNDQSKVSGLFQIIRAFMREPKLSSRFLRNSVPAIRGFDFSQKFAPAASKQIGTPSSDETRLTTESNPLRDFFNARQEGPGIWKWEHYFDIYHNHFSKFVGREVHILEVGIYSGGSLDMWRSYFGPQCRIYGVDIEEACKIYEGAHTKVFIGDQADRNFWKRFREEAPVIDIIIDDGGHLPEQQTVTLEEMLPHLRPGGVYMCEDVHGVLNHYASFVHGLAHQLNEFDVKQIPGPGSNQVLVKSSEFQRSIRSVHLYPFVTVFEKADRPVDSLVCPRHGTQWQPFSFFEGDKKPQG